MDYSILQTNLTSPALLYFILGIIAVRLKSDLEIPAQSSKFISLYLLFAIGFKGGQELTHSTFSAEIFWSLLLGLLISFSIPIYTFFILRKKFSIENSGAIAAAYGSVSAVTFVAAVAFLEIQEISFGGHMVAVMALMEAPAIIAGVALMRITASGTTKFDGLGKVVKHSFTNGSVMMILGSLVIGLVSDDQQAEGIKPFTTDIFKGFLVIFLLDMGIKSGRNIDSFFKSGWFPFIFAIVIPVINGIAIGALSGFVTDDIGNRFMFAVLSASASYIAVPAAMKLAAPAADPGIYLPMALAVTFPFNLTLGMPIYMAVINNT